MNKRLFATAFAILSSCCAFTAAAGDNDDMGMDLSVGVEKKLTQTLDIDLEYNLRTQDNTSQLERMGLGVGLGYKLVNTKKFNVKFNVGFEYIYKYTLKSTEDKYSDVKVSGSVVDRKWSGYNETASFWRGRSRASVGFSASYKPNKRWSFSLKETFQYNHYNVTDSIDIVKYRIKTNLDDEEYISTEKSKKVKEAKNRTVLRSKLGAQYDIRHSPFAPYASVDYGRGMNYNVNKWKFTAGTDFKINKQHKINVFYRFQTENDDDEPNGHIIGLGYNYKF